MIPCINAAGAPFDIYQPSRTSDHADSRSQMGLYLFLIWIIFWWDDVNRFLYIVDLHAKPFYHTITKINAFLGTSYFCVDCWQGHKDKKQTQVQQTMWSLHWICSLAQCRSPQRSISSGAKIHSFFSQSTKWSDHRYSSRHTFQFQCVTLNRNSLTISSHERLTLINLGHKRTLLSYSIIDYSVIDCSIIETA
jgi:hypothetical protein